MIIILLLAGFITSCATLYGDKTRIVAIDTKPTGAKIYVNGILYGKTPGAILIASANYSGQPITLKKVGYKDQEFLIRTVFQTVGYWNLVFPPDFLIDMGDGTMFKIDPRDLNITVPLKKIESAITESEVLESQAIKY